MSVGDLKVPFRKPHLMDHASKALAQATEEAINALAAKVPQGVINLDALGRVTSNSMNPSGVTAGSYTSTDLTVDAEGRITAAANGSGGASVVVAYQKTENATYTNLTATVPYADTIPAGTDGAEIMKITYAMTNAANRLKLRATIFACEGAPGGGANPVHAIAFFNKDAGAAIRTNQITLGGNDAGNLCLEWEGVPGDTSSHDWRVRMGPDNLTGSAVLINGSSFLGGRIFGGSAAAFFELWELSP